MSVKSTLSLFLAAPLVKSATLNPQNTITTGTMNDELYFQRVLKIGAAVSRDSDDTHALNSAQLWSAWELFTEWINVEKGGINVNGEKWGVEVIEVEDFSDPVYANNAANQLVNASNYDVDFMFGPFSSGLTKGVLDITDKNSKIMMSSGSAYAYVWDGTVKYGFGMLYRVGSNYEDSLTDYVNKGAKTVSYFCNNNVDLNTCGSISKADITAQFASIGLTMASDHFIPLDPKLSTYKTNLKNAVGRVGTAKVDVIVVHDYDTICVDFPEEAAAMNWTPNGLFLEVCDMNPDVREHMGTDLWYAGSQTEWDESGTAQSGISGYTSQQYTDMFEKEFNFKPNSIGSAAFAGAEILVSAIEQQAAADVSKVLDTQTLSDRILAGSWPTLKSSTPITFSNMRQAIGKYVPHQYTTSSVAVKYTDLVYPMPSFVGRATATDDSADTTTPATSTVNNYYSNDCDDNNMAVAIALTAIFCLLGGVGLGAGIFYVAVKSAAPGLAKQDSSSKL